MNDLQSDLHNILIGQPVQQLAARTGLPVPPGVAEAPIPVIDPWLGRAKLIIQVGGIVGGVLTGNPVLSSVCVKSLAHDEIASAVEKGH